MKILWILTISTLLIFANKVVAEEQYLSLGLFPYVSTSKLIVHNKNIKRHIDETTKYKLSLVTAKNIKNYIENIKNYKYDFIFSAPHLARYVEKKYAYQRVAMTTNKIRAVLLVKKDSPLNSIADLKGKVISMAPKKTILHQIVLNMLERNHISPSQDVKINIAKTHNNAIYDVLNDNSDVAVTGINIWGRLLEKNKKKLKQLTLTEATTGFVILAKPNFEMSKLNDFKDALLTFNNSELGKDYIFKGFKLVTDKDMESLDFHAKVFE